jgi:predicted Zn-dependent protease with MMP-like domain
MKIWQCLLLGLVAFIQSQAIPYREPDQDQTVEEKSLQQMQAEVERLDKSILDMAMTNHVRPVVDVLQHYTKSDSTIQGLLSRLTVKVNPTDSYIGNASSYVERRSADVEVDSNLILSIFTLSQLHVMETLGDSYQKRIIVFWARYGQDSRVAIRQGWMPSLVLNLDEYVPDPLYREFINDASSEEADAAIAFVVLHEIGHHVLGHTDRYVPGHPETLKCNLNFEESRKCELDADHWAFQKLQELRFSMRDVWEYLNRMSHYQADVLAIQDGKKEPASPLRLAEYEKGSDHPTWATRAKALIDEFDVNAHSPAPYIIFKAAEVFNHTDGTRNLVEMTLFFPDEKASSTWGMGYVRFNVSRESPDLIPMWVEYRNGQANLIGESGKLRIVVETPSKFGSFVDYAYAAPSGLREYKLGGWYATFAMHQLDEVANGITFGDMLEKSNPILIAKGVVDQMDWDQSLKDSVVGVEKSCTPKFNVLQLRYHKGMTSLSEMQSDWSKTTEECGQLMKTNLGEQRLKAFQQGMINLIVSTFPNGPPK